MNCKGNGKLGGIPTILSTMKQETVQRHIKCNDAIDQRVTNEYNFNCKTMGHCVQKKCC